VLYSLGLVDASAVGLDASFDDEAAEAQGLDASRFVDDVIGAGTGTEASPVLSLAAVPAIGPAMFLNLI
jgi:hypothetical protein